MNKIQKGSDTYMPPFSAEMCPYTVRAGDTPWLLAQRFHTTVEAIMSANPMLDAHNLRIGQIIWIPQPCEPSQTPNQTPGQSRPPGISRMELALSNHMRLLWEQHVYWTRMAMISTIFNLPDADAVTARLLRNPKDFQAALRPFYGNDTAARFAELLTTHLKTGADLVGALKDRNATAAADIEKRWYANADQIAAFLAEINPFWTVQEWRNMLYDHLALLKSEAIAILSQRYAESVDIFDDIEKQALMMADAMTQGIVRQFPQFF